ncbi:hypothetical protein [Pseudonocardia sp. TMWB2A]|uniref:hypothetical protein n=1 Tax=Pseudonocardia sp. TMWB2A TaxID=687430 RepID=UPI003FD1AA18
MASNARGRGEVGGRLGGNGPQYVQAEVDTDDRPETTTEESEELKRLRQESTELRRANEILKTASAFSAAAIDRPQGRW